MWLGIWIEMSYDIQYFISRNAIISIFTDYVGVYGFI